MKELKESPSKKFRRLLTSYLTYLRLPKRKINFDEVVADVYPKKKVADNVKATSQIEKVDNVETASGTDEVDNVNDSDEEDYIDNEGQQDGEDEVDNVNDSDEEDYIDNEDQQDEEEVDNLGEFDDDEYDDDDDDSESDFHSNSTGSKSNRGFFPVLSGTGSIFGPTLWNIASVISLSVNVILVLVLLIVALALNSYGMSLSSMLDIGTHLLGGLYGNFEKMDRAHITTNIPINASIPVQFDLAINQETSVVLSQDVTINNARVTVNTGGLNITQAATTIILPQGTNLPITLNLTVPVNTSIPVVLDVPVDIPLQDTQLHEPFTGLQEVIRPLYCLINSDAKNSDGNPICQ